ncbi:MAG: PDZ domain-containing protein [Planctomycetes bacterium]|nr:PDZ domain-containing protein [Planctomycetota bacterium]
MKASTLRIGLWACLLPVAAFCVYQFADFVFRGGKDRRTHVDNAKTILERLRPPVKQTETIRHPDSFYKCILDVNLSGVMPKPPDKPDSRPAVVDNPIMYNPLDKILGLHVIAYDPEAPVTSLAFVFWKDEQISSTDRKITILREGMWLPKPYNEKFRVKNIRFDGVVFEDEKKAEHVLLLQKTVYSIPIKGGAKGNETTSRPVVNTGREGYAPPSETIKKSESEYWLSPKDTQEFGDKGLEMVGRDIHAVTYYDSKTKRPVGLRVARIRPDSLAGKFGLKENDIVKDVNGAQIRTTADIYEYSKQNPDVREIVISVERFGRTIQMTYVLPK